MAEISRDVDSRGTTNYGAGLRRRWWVVALGVLLGLAAGYAFTTSRTPQYTSRTSVLVDDSAATSANSTATGRASSGINLQTESEIVRSAQVAAEARKTLGTTTSETSLLENVTVTVPTNSQVLQVSYIDSTAKAAQAGASAFARAYITYRTTTNKKDVASAVGALNVQLKAATIKLQLASDQVAALPANSQERVYAEANRNILISQITNLNSQLTTLNASELTAGSVITEASLPTTASSPIPALNLGAGAVAGLLLGLALAMFADRADHRLRQPGDVVRRLGLPVLAEVPPMRLSQSVPGTEQAALFDRLRNSVTANGTPGLIQVADPGGGGASSTVALQLAASLARTNGEAYLLIAHPRSALTSGLGLEPRAGLTDVLRGDATLADVCCSVAGLPDVKVVPPGRDPHELDSLLQSPRLRAIAAALRDSKLGVVAESLSPGESAGAQSLAAQHSTVVLVAERGISDDRVLGDAAEGAVRMGAEVAGVVLAPSPSQAASNGRRATKRRPAELASAAPAGAAARHTNGRSAGGANDPADRAVLLGALGVDPENGR